MAGTIGSARPDGGLVGTYKQAARRLDHVVPRLAPVRHRTATTVLDWAARRAPDPVGRLRRRLDTTTGETPLPHTNVVPSALPSFDDLSEPYPEDRVPPLDRSDVDESSLTWDQLHWRRNGFLVLPGFVPGDRIDAYLALRDRLGVGLGGLENTVWAGTDHEVLALGCFAPLAAKIRELVGEDLGLNFTLSQFTTTERAWHQDDYLGPDDVHGRYAAAWLALDDIHPDSGPFELVVGSHRWNGMRRRLIAERLEPEVRTWLGTNGQPAHWASIAESFTTPAYEAKIAAEGQPTFTFAARRGDVLVWHGKLVHRGTRARVPGRRRPALICHYFPLDLGGGGRRAVRFEAGGYYWPERHTELRANSSLGVQGAATSPS